MDKPLVEIAVEAAADKKASDIVVLDLAELLKVVDHFVVCSGSSARQLKTIAEEVEARLKQQADMAPTRREGTGEGGWILLDYTDFVVHIFSEDCRDFYDLERLWQDAPRRVFEDAATA